MYEKKYYININGEYIEVGEEIYTEYMRHKWREEKQNETKSKKECPLDDTYTSDNNLVEDIVTHKLLLEQLYSSIQDLSEDELTLIHNIYYEDLSAREISRKTGTPRQTIDSRKNKILDKLKNNLKEII